MDGKTVGASTANVKMKIFPRHPVQEIKFNQQVGMNTRKIRDI